MEREVIGRTMKEQVRVDLNDIKKKNRKKKELEFQI